MLKTVIAVSFFLLIIAIWNRNNLHSELKLHPQLQQAPLQSAVLLNPFEASVNDQTYEVAPLYDYELYGLVVSYKLHDGNYGLHRRWGDHLNVADVCVVWQETAFSKHLNKIDVWNGEFTCNFKTHSDVAWANFRTNQISNNHLISADNYIRRQISKVSIGDQIKVTGWLSNYGQGNHPKRSTSTTRDDTGNGACETIYVNDFRILSHNTSPWRIVMYMTLLVLVLSIAQYLRQPFKVG
jgi:hypothetical protein